MRRLSTQGSLAAGPVGGSDGAGQCHVVGNPREIIDPEFSRVRQASLDEQLKELGIEPEDLLGDADLVGSPALKTYNSFVTPRESKMAHARAEDLAPASKRAAYQVAFLFRQRKSELADWLRNKDRARDARKAAGVALQPLTLVLDNVRSAYNVGSILRTAETAGVTEVICCGLTPTPPHEKVAKTAFDAAETVPTRHFPSTVAALEALKADGFKIFAMETTSKSKRYTRVEFPRRVALVLGNEVTGVDHAVMDACDGGIIEIPTYGMKNSLCVSSAAPVVIFEVLRQWGATDAESLGL
eukprot:CAMPEP_0172624034 /NCGR_PEP_ID=MMETSP1068-20121228/133414_1 /TAXON_ID=35684 /ORGANISM="Pseudopedinella elastica, Strain CCMP716" /LENGTH=298 /DNA_ID=CAMNT_0013432819 /DNA_START=228 /DNA_END=1124 /DNA_ORIENTATION=-